MAGEQTYQERDELLKLALTGKVCSACQQLKSSDEFHKNRSTKDGMGSWCKPCTSEHNKKSNKKPVSKELRKQLDDARRERIVRIQQRRRNKRLPMHRQPLNVCDSFVVYWGGLETPLLLTGAAGVEGIAFCAFPFAPGACS